MKRFIDKYEVLLLDVGQTFMFDVDRFGVDDNIGNTYIELGGQKLAPETAADICIDVFDEISAASLLPENYEKLPTVECCLKKRCKDELDILEQTIALHEIGDIPDEYLPVLHQLGKTHRLGIISDIWSKGDIFYRKFRDAGIVELFEEIIFSSEAEVIKPSTKIFELALAKFNIAPEKVVYIGDSYRRDVCGAHAAGIDSILISDNHKSEECPFPGLIVKDLRDIL